MEKTQPEPTLIAIDATEVRLHQMLTLLGGQPRGALLDRVDGTSDTRLFLDPATWIQVDAAKGIPAALQRLDELRKNLHLFGWFSYEFAAALEPCLRERRDYRGPLLEFGGYTNSIQPSSNTALFQDSEYEISDLRPDTDQETYLRQVETILGHIRVGNVYQVNFTVRLQFRFEGDPRALFLSLRRSQPVENAQMLRNNREWTISFSPELFFQIRGSEIEVRPMKGTLGRGRTTEEDEIQRERLGSSPKDRAENLMIVDLMRNDLGRISSIGSVGVSRLFEVQRLPTLFQMTSTVKAHLRRDLSLRELLTAVFPSGSVTGTPKLAAMGYINELETSPRGVYCGALGRFSPEETTFNVPIRTLVLKRRDSRCHSDPRGIYDGELGIGSGIVADSDPMLEWDESLLKSSFLLDTSPRFSLVETIRFERGWRRLSGHLARLAGSAKYFGFAFDEQHVLGALRRCSTALGGGVFKVRLLLDDRGEPSTEVERIRPVQSPVRLAFSPHRTDPLDPFLFHKTTHRTLYRQAQQTARRSGLWDLVFQNRYGEITEGSISNIFAKINGKWCTPPQRCGLLAGVMREELMQTLESEERALRTEDLQDAEELIVTNSVREVLPAQLVVLREQLPQVQATTRLL